MRITAFRYGIAAFLGLACGEGTSPIDQTPVPGFKVLSEEFAADTVLAVIPGLLRLQLRDASAMPARHVSVRFHFPSPASVYACAATATTCGGQPNNDFDLPTDTAGMVSIRLQHSRQAGTKAIEVSAPSLGMSTTVSVETLPGRATRFVGTTDTAVYAGVSYGLSIKAVDQFSNQRADVVTFESLTPAVATVTNGQVTAVSVGRGSFMMKAGAFEQAAYVSVPPPGRLAVGGIKRPAGIDVLLMNTDGGSRRLLFLTPGHVQFSFVKWHPGGQRLTVLETGGNGNARIFAYDTATLARTPVVDTVEFTEAVEPTFVASGARVYFNGTRGGAQGLYRANGDGSSAELFAASKAFASVAPDESSVLVGSGGSVVRRILATGAETFLVNTGRTPFWSAAGDLIGYMTGTATPDLRVIRPDGTGDRLIASGVGDAKAFSPNGEWVAIRRYPAGGLDLVRVSDGLRLPIPATNDYLDVAWRP